MARKPRTLKATMTLPQRTVFKWVLVIAGLSVAGWWLCVPHYVRLSGRTMGSTYHITFKKYRWMRTQSIQREIQRAFVEIDRQMSTYRPDSEISRFNRLRDTQPISLPPEMTEVLRAVQNIHRLSDGKFDPTIFPLIRAWGFGGHLRQHRVLSPREIQTLRAKVGFHHLVLLPDSSIQKTIPELSLDLSGIVPGYTADAVGRLLERRHIYHYMVEIGGEIRLRGHPAVGKTWKIGIRTPDGSHHIAAILNLTDAGVATSGNYENYFIRNGKRYSHILDPHTGRPTVSVTASATVVAPDSMSADALATALLLYPPSEGLQWIASLPHTDALVMWYEAGTLKTAMTPGMRRYVEGIPEFRHAVLCCARRPHPRLREGRPSASAMLRSSCSQRTP